MLANYIASWVLVQMKTPERMTKTGSEGGETLALKGSYYKQARYCLMLIQPVSPNLMSRLAPRLSLLLGTDVIV